MQPKTIQVFVSYSHEDDLWVQEGPHGLIPWLAHVLRREHVQIWYDHALKQMPGEDYKKLIKSEIDRADFAILLISQDFVASDFIQEYELPWIRQRLEAEKLGLITILVGPVCDEDLDWLADRQMLPGKPMPLIDYTDNVAHWQRVRHEILQAVRSRLRAFRESSGGATTPSPPDEAGTAAASDTLAVESPPVSRPISGKPEAVQPSAAVSPVDSSSAMSRAPAATAASGKVIVPNRVEAVTPPSSPLEVITNSIGMELALIPAGEFLMGSPETDRDADQYPFERPQHRVQITRPFYLAVYPVTQFEYERIMTVNPSHHKSAGPMAPVERVLWKDAQEFCSKLTAFPEERAAGRAYRLPTEAEWEYACRAGAQTRYSFGDSAGDLGDYGWFNLNSSNTTHPVGQKQQNSWGLKDMHGHVFEWCADRTRHYSPIVAATPSSQHAAACHVVFTSVTSLVVDPTGPTQLQIGVVFYACRGGCYCTSAGCCRSAYRVNFQADVPCNAVGFRVAANLLEA